MNLGVFKSFSPLLCTILVAACSSGGGSNGDNDDPVDVITLVDSLPQSGSVSKANTPHFSLTHLATAGTSYDYSAPCNLASSRIIIRSTDDLSSGANNQLLDHQLTCNSDLPLNSNITLTLEESSATTNKEATLSFNSAASITAANNLIVVSDEQTLPLNSIGNITALTLLQSAIDDADLSPVVEALVLSLLNDIADDDLPNLLNPATEFDVVTQSVLYESIDPYGNLSQALSGFIAFPDTTGVSDFIAKNEIILLNHSTGLTPSEQSTSDTWYNLAIILASRGYLVVAPDNFGRGNTSTNPETYLLAKQTGINSVDLLSNVINSGNYDSVLGASSGAKNVAIVGYSQGGHSAVAAWQEILHTRQGELNTTQLFTGAGPYNIYETVKGIINFANGTCLLDDYCRYINDELVNAYAIERILPPIIEYSNTNLTEVDLIDGTQLVSEFVSGFMANDSLYDPFKALLQLNSFTNINNPEVAFADSDLDVYFYHSDYDRLVVQANTDELSDDLTGYVQSINDESAACNSSNIQLLFVNVTEVGVIHGICGVVMVDDVLGRFD